MNAKGWRRARRPKRADMLAMAELQESNMEVAKARGL